MKPLPRWFFAIVALCGVARLPAQSAQQVTVNAVVPVLMNLTVDNNNVQFTFAQGDYGPDGFATNEAVNATTFKVSSNTRWRLYVSSNSQNFSFNPSNGGLDPRKNCGDLSLSPFNSVVYFPVSTNDRDVASGGPGGFDDNGHRIPMSYRLRTSLVGDPPGTYTLTLTYTLMAQ